MAQELIDRVGSPHPSGVECLDVVQWFDFLLGSAIMHIWEAGQGRTTVLEDLRKARYFLDRKIAQLEKD